MRCSTLFIKTFIVVLWSTPSLASDENDKNDMKSSAARLLGGMTKEETCQADLVTCHASLTSCLMDQDIDVDTENIEDADDAEEEENEQEEEVGDDNSSAPATSLGLHSYFRPPPVGLNVCEGSDPKFENAQCIVDGIVTAIEQAGTNVTAGYVGNLATEAQSIVTSFFEAGLCPVNVHWHRGTEHYSAGQYDETGTGPRPRELDSGEHGSYPNAPPRLGYECLHYNETDLKFTTPYDWKFCKEMEVGETYEVHWPHSTAGACGTLNQYQTPFKDGVFCKSDDIALDPSYLTVGVQAQVFVIVNDEDYYFPDLMRGMIAVDDDDNTTQKMGQEITKYTGSFSGSEVDNELCSQYAPITWHVDRICHLISASSFDKMCADMMTQRDDLSGDMEPHGARELVADELAANNHHNRAFR